MCQFSGVLDEETRDFIKPYADKWKSKSLFQVILQYRAVKQHELFNFAQQVLISATNEVVTDICDLYI